MALDFNPMHPPLLSRDASGYLDSEQEILTAIDNYRSASWTARWSRISRNKTNWDMYHGRQDFSHKMKHQSKDVMPDFPMAFERIALTFSQPFMESTEWFDVEGIGLGPEAFDPVTLRKWMMFYLNRLYTPGDYEDTIRNFAQVMADSAKMACMESIACLKIYAVLCDRFNYMLEAGNPLTQPTADGGSDYQDLDLVVKQVAVPTLRIAIDVIPWEDWFPDPSGQAMYDIHEKSVTLQHLRNNPDYDQDTIDSLANTKGGTVGGTEPEYEKRRRSDQDYPTTIAFASLPRIRETWGDIVDMRTGKTLLRNSLCTTTVSKKFLRDPVPNPFWHGRRPFVSCPILRVPLSVVHKALADHAAPVARSMNELDNLMLDGAIGSVWGTRQVKPSMLENPEEIGDGVPQGYTAIIKDGAQLGEKFLERVDTAEVPAYAVEMARQKASQFQTATALPDTAQGNLPQREVKATEIAQTSAASTGLFGGLSSGVERGLVCPALQLVWMTLWQYVDDFLEPEVVQIIGPERALVLQSMPAAERFVMMAQSIRFEVKGLRQLAQAQEMFSRLTTFLQSLGTNPAFAMAFDSKYDVVKFMDDIMRSLRLDPSKYEKDPAAPSAPMGGPAEMGVPTDPAAPAPAGAIASPSPASAKGGTGPGGPTRATPAAHPGTNGTGKFGSQIEAAMAQTNPAGWRGTQQ